MSGIFFVGINQGSREEVLKVLEGVPIICADMSGTDIFSFKVPEKFCLCIGNEEIKKISNHRVKIPMSETCESLNAAVSAGISMYVLKNMT